MSVTSSLVEKPIGPGSLALLSLKALVKPSEDLFRAGAQASTLSVSLFLLIWTLSAALFGWVGRLLYPLQVPAANGSTHVNTALFPTLSLLSSAGQLVLVPLIFLLDMGIIYALARRNGGNATFRAQSAGMLLFLVPLGIISESAVLIPYVSALIVLASIIYGLVLQVKATRALHGITFGQAIGAVLLPLVALFFFACISSIGLAAALFAPK